MNSEIEKAYYDERIKKDNFNQPFEYIAEYEKESFRESLSFKLFVARRRFILLFEQIKSKLFNSQKHTY